MKSQADQITSKIKSLPPLSVIVQKLLEVIKDDDSSAGDVSKVLSTDQALAAKVLKLVNSSFYGLPRKISTISRAVVILGYSAVRNLALGLSMYDTLKGMKKDTEWESFWEHSIYVAAGCEEIASHIGYKDPEEAFVAGLMHDIGILVINITFPDKFKTFYNQGLYDYAEQERELFGMTHNEAGIRLLEHWKLPENLCRTARFHHSFNLASREKEPLLTTVMLADSLAIVSGRAHIDKKKGVLLLKLASSLKLSFADCAELLSRITRRVQTAKEFLNIAEPANNKILSSYQTKEKNIVVVGKDKERVGWVRAVIKSFDYKVLPMDAIIAISTEHNPVDLVVIDPENVGHERLCKLESALGDELPHIIIINSSKESIACLPDRLSQCPRINLMFSREQLDALMQGVLK